MTPGVFAANYLMSPAEHVRRLHRYDQWANGLSLESLRDVDDGGFSLRIFGHILGAQQAWLTRLRRQDSSKVIIWEQLTFSECAERFERLAAEITQYLDELTDNDTEEPCSYANQRGESFENTRFDILVHVFMHCHHHRGQIATAVRQGGGNPAATDFIFFVRSHES
ncbi:MAG: DinB family protein [Acidobacteria bacterium]|nr:DinB family protein [Acidobacteriota bacterium]